MPMGLPYAYHNKTDAPTRALFWVSPAGRLKELFDALHDFTDIEEVLRLSALHEVSTSYASGSAGPGGRAAPRVAVRSSAPREPEPAGRPAHAADRTPAEIAP
jgi:hypothetical protein